MRQKIEFIAKQAGQLIMNYFGKAGLATQTKSDNSPVTKADLEADKLIMTALAKEFALPIISEESFHKQLLKSDCDTYFLVDPLDGTKEFIKNLPYFTVNIALIKKYQPVLGVIYAPAFDEMYSCENGVGYKDGAILKSCTASREQKLKAVISSSHPDSKLQSLMTKNSVTSVEKIGSSYKFCMLADGRANFYMRFNPTSEWDTAAGQALCEALGFEMLSTEDLSRIAYGKKDLINPGFFVKPLHLPLIF